MGNIITNKWLFRKVFLKSFYVFLSFSDHHSDRSDHHSDRSDHHSDRSDHHSQHGKHHHQHHNEIIERIDEVIELVDCGGRDLGFCDMSSKYPG